MRSFNFDLKEVLSFLSIPFFFMGVGFLLLAGALFTVLAIPPAKLASRIWL